MLSCFSDHASVKNVSSAGARGRDCRRGYRRFDTAGATFWSLSLAIPLRQIHSVSHVSMVTREFSGALLPRSPPSAPSVITANVTPARRGPVPESRLCFYAGRTRRRLSRERAFKGRRSLKSPHMAPFWSPVQQSNAVYGICGCNWFQLNYIFRVIFIFGRVTRPASADAGVISSSMQKPAFEPHFPWTMNLSKVELPLFLC